VNLEGTVELSNGVYVKGTCVVGLDLSLTSTGMVFVFGDGINDWRGFTYGYGLKKASVEQKVERLRNVAVMVMYFVENIKARYVAVEGLSFGSRGKIADLAELAGVVKVELFRRDIIPLIVAPMQGRKYLLGKGAGAVKKEEVRRCLKMMKFKFPDTNQMDAWVVANYFRGQLKLPSVSGGFQACFA